MPNDTVETPAPPRTAVRILPADEHHKLSTFPFAERRGLPDPDRTLILVAENPDGEIVGVWAAMTTVHLEGLWVAESYRRTSRVAVQLLRAMRALLTQLGIVQSFTYTEDANVLVLALKAGFTRLPGDLLFLELPQSKEN